MSHPVDAFEDSLIAELRAGDLWHALDTRNTDHIVAYVREVAMERLRQPVAAPSRCEECKEIVAECWCDEEGALPDEDYDGAPYCSYGHRTKASCDCGPIASNE